MPLLPEGFLISKRTTCYKLHSASFQFSALASDFPFECHNSTSPQSLYISNKQSHFLLCISITTPEDELQQLLKNSRISTFILKKQCIFTYICYYKFHDNCQYIGKVKEVLPSFAHPYDAPPSSIVISNC